MDSIAIPDHEMDRIIVNADSFMQAQKPVVAHQMDVTEIPSMIAVETIFITDQLAKQKKIQLSQALILSSLNIEADTEINSDASLRKVQDVGIMVEPNVEHVAGQTEAPNPQRDREIQTLIMPNQKDIGIQCEWESDTFFVEDFDPLGDDIGKKSYKQFLEFVHDNTYMYGNSKTECMKCGEVCRNSKQTFSHMAMHWGPSALCEVCGASLEHSSLLSLHQCGFGPPKKNSKHIVYQQCPLYACGIMLTSNMKLFSHIEDHMNLDFYQGLTTTAQTRSLANLCRSTRLNKLSLTKRIRQQSDYKRILRWSIRDGFRCQICLIRSTSSAVFVRHRKKCIKRFMKRLKNIKHKNMSSNEDNRLNFEFN